MRQTIQENEEIKPTLLLLSAKLGAIQERQKKKRKARNKSFSDHIFYQKIVIINVKILFLPNQHFIVENHKLRLGGQKIKY